MSLHLPVCSFPDVVSHDRSTMDVDLRILVTPSPCKRRIPIPYLSCVLGSSCSRTPTPPTPSISPEPEPEHVDAVIAGIQKRSVYSNRCEDTLQAPMIAQSSLRTINDEFNHHDAHHRRMSEAPARHRPSRMGVQPAYRAPRSTKESIATLGLSRRTPSPDSSSLSDTDSMVACCYSSGWIEPQALPPLPPVPPPSPPPFQNMHMEPPSRSSSLGRDIKETFKILPDTDSTTDDPDAQELDACSEQSSVPPSPITFSHRNSAFITMESTPGIEILSRPTITTVPLSTDAVLRWRETPSSSPASSPIRKHPPPLSVEFAPDVAAHPWTRVSHFSPALFAASPKLLKPGQIPPQPTLPSGAHTCTMTKLGAKLPRWKFFRRRHSVSSDGDGTSAQPPHPESEAKQDGDAEPRAPSQGSRTSCRKRQHRNSIHVASISSLHTDSIDPRRSSMGSERTLSNADAMENMSGMHRLSEQKSVNTLRSVTTHRAAGDTWREEDIENVINTLRTMKVSRMK